MPSNLPIEALRAKITHASNTVRRLVLSAPTGSGKSTQVPQILLDGGCVPEGQRVVVLQPRRLAARMLATRVALERGSPVGAEVGYHIRLERRFGAETRILFVTEGILLRMMLADPTLPEVAAIVFDEFHERHLYSDLGLAMVRELQKRQRPDLQILVMSATLESESLANYLSPAETLVTEGRTYPLTVSYSAAAHKVAEAPVWDAAAHHFGKLAAAQRTGDVLIFMPGAYEIQRTVESIRGSSASKGWLVFPLYGELPPKEQDAAVASYDAPKVVVATNVAETSITIDGITAVIDAGLARVARYDPHRGINTLLVEKISQASAEQRAGRAGRTAPGHVLRLWSEKEHAHRPPREDPEVKRVDLSEIILALKLHGVERVRDFPWFEAPEESALQRALTVLRDLGALDRHEGLTGLGRRMAAFPVHPRYARMLLAAGEYGCVWQICVMAAISQGRRLLLPLRDKRREAEREALFGESSSDFFHALRAWGMARKKNYEHGFCRQWGIHAKAAREAEQLAAQFAAIARAQGLDASEGRMDETAVRKCLLLGFSDHLARRDNRATLRCSLVHGRRGELRRDSTVREAALFVAAEIDEIETRGDVTVLLSMATEIEESWLVELFPDDIEEATLTQWDAGQKRMAGRRVRRFRDLILEEKETGEPDREEAAAMLTELVLEGRVALKNWNDSVETWIARVNFAARHLPDLGIAAIDQAGRRLLIEQICHGCTSARDLREADPWPALHAWLTQEQHMAMKTLVPRTFHLPTRRNPLAIRYETENDRAVISSRLQDFYDIDPGSLCIGGGKIPLTIEMLAPNGRPCQVTSDLATFWKTSYEDVKKELKGRYPKHEWRDYVG